MGRAAAASVATAVLSAGAANVLQARIVRRAGKRYSPGLLLCGEGIAGTAQAIGRAGAMRQCIVVKRWPKAVGCRGAISPSRAITESPWRSYRSSPVDCAGLNTLAATLEPPAGIGLSSRSLRRTISP